MYCEANDDAVGNGGITKALVELEKYHDALDGDFYRESLFNEDAERAKQHHTVNHRVGAPPNAEACILLCPCCAQPSMVSHARPASLAGTTPHMCICAPASHVTAMHVT